MNVVELANPSDRPPIQINRKNNNAHTKDVMPCAIEGGRRCMAAILMKLHFAGCRCKTNRRARRLRRRSHTTRRRAPQGGETDDSRTKKFTEPVALSSSGAW